MTLQVPAAADESSNVRILLSPHSFLRTLFSCSLLLVSNYFHAPLPRFYLHTDSSSPSLFIVRLVCFSSLHLLLQIDSVSRTYVTGVFKRNSSSCSGTLFLVTTFSFFCATPTPSSRNDPPVVDYLLLVLLC